MSKNTSLYLGFEDVLALQKVAFDWAESYDTKNWDRLSSICAPTLSVCEPQLPPWLGGPTNSSITLPPHLDYTQTAKDRGEIISAEEYITKVSDRNFLGNPAVKTHHWLGGSWLERISDTEVVGHHQIRVAHQVDAGPDREEVEITGHSHSTNEIYYQKVDGVWKFAGLRPFVHWNEGKVAGAFSPPPTVIKSRRQLIGRGISESRIECIATST